MKYAGSDGVAAYGAIMYVNFMFIAVFIGYAIGSAPIISFNYGAEDHVALKNIFRKSIRLIGVMAIVMTAAGEILCRPLARMFVGYDSGLMEMTVGAFRIYIVMYLICGFNIFGSDFFTALNNGTVSAVISFLRTLVFQTGAVFLLPALFGLNGIWCAIIVAEIMAMIVTLTFIFRLKDRYHYM